MPGPYDAGARRTAARVFVCACSPGYSCFACGEVERLQKALDKLPPPCPDCPRLYAEINMLQEELRKADQAMADMDWPEDHEPRVRIRIALGEE